MKTWTPEEMYMCPDKFGDEVPPKKLPGRFTPEFRDFVATETKWVIENPHALHFPQEHRKPVGTGEMKCPLCQGTFDYWVVKNGQTTGLRMQVAVLCQCKQWKKFWMVWKTVPERFADADLTTMQPSAQIGLSIERQNQIQEFVRAHPRDSYFLYGRAGTRKTHLATALYRAALYDSAEEQFRRGISCANVWRISTLQMLQESTDWNSRDKQDPDCPDPGPHAHREGGRDREGEVRHAPMPLSRRA